MKLRIVFAGFLVMAGLSISGLAFAATPTLALSLTGGDSAQLTLTGDPNSTAVLFYNVGAPSGALTSILGTMDSSGQLTKTISISSLGLNSGNSVYVMVNSQQSSIIPWQSTASSASTSSVITFSQGSAALTQGQNVTISVYGGNGTYSVSSNSNSAAVGATISGSSLNLSGVAAGSANLVICDSVGRCAAIVATVSSGSTSATGAVTFDQPNPTVAIGQILTVNISGGTAFYVGTNSNPGIMTYVLNGNSMMITGVSSGSAVVSVCSATNSGSCASLTVTVGASSGSSGTTTTNQAVSFSVTNPTVVVNQTINVMLSGATAYFVSINSNPIAVQTSVGGNVLMITGVAPGSTSLTVCAAGTTNCGTLQVTVASTAATTVVAPPVTVVTTTPVATTTSVNNSATLIATIQLMKNQLSQMLLAIQAMQTQLNQLLATVSISTPAVSSSVSASASTAPFSGTFTSFLSLNSTGAEVTALQKKLSADGFYSGPITGTFGPLTESALKKFQSANGIDPAGYVGPSTRAALNQ